ncbi:MAG TPA: hypothetical protein VHI93_00170 [Candidatus Thermoplasmatota archaeon]|nr:hypothetical protein [Candidatus Thermoplasmatota archaeon]
MPRTTLATVALLLLLAVPLAPAATAAPLPMFAEPSPLNRLVHDPWIGGTWLGSNAGLLLLQPGLPPRQVTFRDGLPGMKVYDIAVTPDRVWVSTAYGPAVYDKGDGSVQPLLGPDGAPLRMESRTIFAEKDAIWVGTNHEGLYRVDPATRMGTLVKNPVNGSDFSQPILGIGADGDEMFLSVTAYGLVVWDRRTGEARHYDTHLLGKRPLYGRLLVTPDRVWVGTSGDGTVYLDRTHNQMGQHASPSSINALNVGGLAQLGEETWFATEAGVSRRDGATDQWRYWQNMPWGNANDVAVVGGDVYAATTRGHILRYDRLEGRWVDMTVWNPSIAPQYNTVNGCEVVGDQVLFSLGGGGAAFYDPALARWKPVEKVPDILVWSSFSEGTRTWFATHRGAALWDRASDAWTYLRTDGRVDASFGNSVRQVAPTPDGAWIATRSYLPAPLHRVGWQRGSLGHWETATNDWTVYRKEQGLPDDNVTRVALTPGKVWAGMLYGGLAFLDLQTQAFQRITPLNGQGTVNALLVHEGALWVATMGGLWRVDPETLEARRHPGTENTPLLSLAWGAGRLWAGTMGAGVFSLDLGTGARTDYRAPGAYDIQAYCLAILDGTLYAGTGTGVERLDLASGRWMPQMGPDVLKRPGSVPLSLRIETPRQGELVEPGTLLSVTGTASGPAGSLVQVRLGDGAWSKAQGLSRWQAQVQLPGPPQEAVLSARLLVAGLPRAQTAVAILSGPGASHDVRHTPVLEAGHDDRVTFAVEAPEPNATATVLLLPPNASTPLRIPLQPSPEGGLVGRSAPLDPPGLWRYRIEVAWEGGSAALPRVSSGYADGHYPLAVRALGAMRAFAAGVACPSPLAPGASGVATMVLQNTGLRPANMSVDLFGPAAAWGSPPAPRELEAAGSWRVEIPLQVPPGTPGGTYPLQGTVRTGGAALDQFSCTVRVAGSGFLGMPGLAPAGALLVLAATVLLRKRRA